MSYATTLDDSMLKTLEKTLSHLFRLTASQTAYNMSSTASTCPNYNSVHFDYFGITSVGKG